MPDPLLSIEGRVRRLVSGGMRRRRPFADIERDIGRLLDSQGITTATADGHYRMNLEAEARRQFDWVGSRTLSAEERRMATTLLGRAGSDYARMGQGIRRDIVEAVERGLRQDLPRSEVDTLVSRAVRRRRSAANTITRTALGGFDRANTIRQATQVGVRRLRYSGPAGERPFCAARVGTIYTLEEIRAMDNGQGLPVLLYGGGYNCRHGWLMALPIDQNRAPDARDTVTQAWFNAKATVAIDDRTRADMNTLAYHMIGRELADEDIVRLTGAPDGATIRVDPDHRDGIHFEISHPLYRLPSDRILMEEFSEELMESRVVLYNQYLRLTSEAPSGMGTRIFATQVEEARRLGIDEFHVQAAGSPRTADWNGYYTWARLGYDALIPPHVRSALPGRYQGAETIQDLFELEGGAQWWKANGDEFNGTFQVNGPSYRILQEYLKERGIRIDD